jgi:Zn-dependent peptidase ImmA (M78 family)
MRYDRWQPAKRLTWHQIEHLKTLRRTQPDVWTVKKLADAFGVSLSAVCRILKSRFEPSDEIKERQDTAAKEQTRKRKEEFLKKLDKSKVPSESTSENKEDGGIQKGEDQMKEDRDGPVDKPMDMKDNRYTDTKRIK